MTLADRAADAIEKRIRGGKSQIGSKLPTVAELAREFGVSPPVIREALSRLRSNGLISTRQGSGSVVISDADRRGFRIGRHSVWDRSSLSQLFEFRADVEATSASRAAAAATRSDVTALRAALRKLKQHIDDSDLGADADLAFHQAIARASHNRFRLELIGYLHCEMHDAIHIARGNSAQSPGKPVVVQREHEAVYRAIERHDPTAADAAMRSHLLAAAERLGLPSMTATA